MSDSEKIWNRRFVLLFLTNLLVLAAFYASIPIIPVYCQEIGLSGTQTGIVLTAMSAATVLFRPIAGYLLDSFNRYRVYLLFLAMFCISFPAFLVFPIFGVLVAIRLYMGAVYSVCGSATMTLAGDVLPAAKVTEGISRFAFTVSIGMAVGPFVGIQVQENLSSQASFMTVFAIAVLAFVCVSLCRIRYPKVQRKRFSLKGAIYKPSLPFMVNMMFLMIPYGAVIAYSSILAQEKGLVGYLPYFYIFLVAGMLASKLSTQKMVDSGRYRTLVYASLVVLVVAMVSYLFLETGVHMLAVGFFFGLGYGVLQPLFQSFVTGTAPGEKRGAANATYYLSYDIGIGIGALLMGFMQESIGLATGFALTSVSYVVGGVLFVVYVDGYYRKLKGAMPETKSKAGLLSDYMERNVFTIPDTATVRDAVACFSQKRVSGVPIVSKSGEMRGFISDGDIVRYLRTDERQPSVFDSSALFMGYLWDPEAAFEEKIEAVMSEKALSVGTDKPISIAANSTLEDLCEVLRENGVKKVPVVEDGRVVGIAFRSLVISYLANRFLLKGENKPA